MSEVNTWKLALVASACAVAGLAPLVTGAEPPSDAAAVSYWRDVRPIFQSHCQGCHQPAKARGEYVIVSPAAALAAGESGQPAIVAGDPEASYLIEQITPIDGHAAMPQDAPPLSEAEIDLIGRWIAAGAPDDSPAGSGPRYSPASPPRYTRGPVVTSMDFSPSGDLLAVSGFHEILLVDTGSWETVGRLIGLSERIESVRFSPDGQRLAASGGSPGRFGEVQIWDVASRELALSVPVTFDTVYGISWSGDGTRIAFGCADNTVRAIDASDGEQVLYQGAHSDWVRDTVFSSDDSHLVSAGRDMTCKLTEVATERFVDNVTSITPGALRGGINALARHPERDEIIVGGADGAPKVYRIYRETERRIGDDANLIRQLPALRGRIFGVAVSADGGKIAAVSSLDGAGQVGIYAYDFTGTLSEELKQILSKRVADRSAEENAKIEAYRTEGGERLALVDVPESAIYSVAFSPDGQLAAAGADGQIRIIDAETGSIEQTFLPVEIQAGDRAAAVAAQWLAERHSGSDVAARSPAESLPEGVRIHSLSVAPAEIDLDGPYAYTQLLITAETSAQGRIDVTRAAALELTHPIAAVDAQGRVTPRSDGTAELLVRAGGQSVKVPVTVSHAERPPEVDFVRDVNPVLTRLGCNQGTCHGSASGKNGFKLSLRGYDPLFDVRGFTDDLAARRINLASPDDSLMLLKASGAVPHEGGVLMSRDDPYYQIVRRWIADGGRLELEGPRRRVERIELAPESPVLANPGMVQQVRVEAVYSDGSRRDITGEAFIESSNTEVVEADPSGRLRTVRRGEAAVLARYEGAYAATPLTVMGDRTGFQWQDPPVWNAIDERTAAKWQRMKIAPSGLSSDAEFIRRATLDLTGLPPTSEAVRAFLADPRETRAKREELVDSLIGNEAFVEHWTNKWADLLQVNRKFLGAEGAASLRQWIRTQVAENRPYDQMVSDILTATGSNKDHPAAAYFKILRTPEELVENTTHLFLGVRFNCNKCHDHPFERWTQDQYYQTAAFFARVGLRRDPASGDQRIGGTAVEGAKPLYEEVFEQPQGEMTHQRTGQPVAPQFPFEAEYQAPEDASRRAQLAAWMTSPDNQYFARSYANRIWGYLTGVGLIEPIDDIRASNPPSNPELLEYLTQSLIDSGFDVRHLMRLICTSRTYSLSVATNPWNEDDARNYSHASPRRLPAEVLYDSVHAALGATSAFPGVPAGTRAAELPDAGVKLEDGFLTNLGRPARESACECERSEELQLGSVMALVSGPTVATAIADEANALPQLVQQLEDDRALVDELFLRILNRPAAEEEIDAALATLPEIAADHQQLAEQLAEREAWWTEEKARLEQERAQAIAAAEQAITAAEQRLQPERERKEAERQERIAAAEKALADAEAKLPERAAKYLAEASGGDREWYPLAAESATSTGEVQLVPQADRAVRASGSDDKAVYTLRFRTGLPVIRGLRLEALPIEGIEGGGPGLPGNGNFVVTELEVKAAPADAPDQLQPVKLVDGKADFSQDGFDPAQAIDGNAGDQQGWAVSPLGGIVHWAVFRLEQPLENPGGTLLEIKIHQQHNAKLHLLGRFRIAATTADGAVELGLPEAFAAVARTPAAQRTDAQRQEVVDYLSRADTELRGLQDAVNVARQPVAEFPELVELRERLKFLQSPIEEDGRLVQLRSDLEHSQRQLDRERLTLAQDLAWALINSPAFLFNR